MDRAVLDEVLALLDGYGPEFKGGFSNHGPMASQALAALGFEAEALRWADRYRHQLEPAPRPGEAFETGAWQRMLGRHDAYPDWEAFFMLELDAAPWERVVGTWGARLLPGLAGAATHGVIRTAHAVRMLEVGDGPFTLRELARGLAYWAATYETLPGSARPTGHLSVAEAVESLPAIPPDRATGIFIDDRLRALSGVEAFPEVVDALATPADVETTLSDVTAVFAGSYLANGQARPIEFVHTVTGPAAVRVLLPYLPPHVHRSAFGYAWQVAAGIHAACAQTLPVGSDEVDVEGLWWDEVAAQALANGDEHAIKMVEACRREDGLRPDPRYLAAAADVVRRLG